MNYQQIYLDLIQKFPDFEIHQNHPLAPYTTLKIGGPADIFIHTKNNFQFKTILQYLSKNSDFAPLLQGGIKGGLVILGNGSNVLISDSGIRGIVIKNSSQKIDILPGKTTSSVTNKISAHRTENDPINYLNFAKIDYDEGSSPKIKVKMTSGTLLPFAINYLFNQGITGLQWFAYIPGTIGGAIWYNLHGGSRHFSDYLQTITVFNFKTNQIEKLDAQKIDWDYDNSHFQKNPHLIILNATFNLYQGDTDRARQTAAAWILQKSKVQPMNSAGSIFQNPPLEICQKIWGEQKSTGWIIDHELNLKGTKSGQAEIGPQHANIFTNNGNATAKDFLNLINLVQNKAKEKLNLNLTPEIKLIGDH
ncbi:hypothetical protein A2574_01405 [Candidatus Shapirobacteria bacterium RIFOXYD1_FULL_38_32]|uniref:UDP-N-acetylenolpyruvoylglucosamine reductase n=2 Tax=Candidatus Shapironibacteriota TaxID=1752721 RepID=A0A0G0MZ47_9BACT|nr:MAG: UDP-N-acetylenolpyruvoylglucosamine reductase [Candidatus Shapirobacteria bacterium GW2011_GWE2_38_30]OGL56400.1 MAG: hypothetical protein A2367_01370 [Candidatus Shapirobacteria bacterium RIFOXYB1_FULL_38_38]OGL56577.1 MAG: hypothetical protein A2195_00720 [Candidatus Shapirobacteria bacterium RIFOXYA1_FULL_39_17]OGL58163.1 MAG: hypothetical protein A2574_01405 [Candidatus Shapirobacteria bacterium RIFOXYD1_FULL_38_32]HCU54940.1 hypothetical protein [Candidatus Shapirobacteria bacteriu